MAAYYNEIDPHAAHWLRKLIAAGHIAPGDVDERSITDVRPDDLEGYTQCHFFAGIGGWSLALRLAGWPDDRPVWTGSCPCQPFSVAGKGKGIHDERHLWPEFARLIRERRPPTVFGEQVAGAAGLAWLDLVQSDLENFGYACGAADLPACSVGAPHRRQRLYWVAHALYAGRPQRWACAGEGQASRGSGACGVADADGGDASAEREQRGREQRQQSQDSRARCMAHADGAGSLFSERNSEPQQPGQQAPHGHYADGCGAFCGVDDAQRARLEGLGRHGDDRNEPGWQRAQPTGSIAASGTTCGVGDAASRRCQESVQQFRNGGEAFGKWETGVNRNAGSWSDLEWLTCSDGKARPTQPGLFPLVAGLPKGLVRGGDRSMARDADQSAEARVMRLRGYGNAIVPQLAAVFIMAAM
jgi:DNA (cytosine-5)-methyltransferase 1